MFCKKCGAKNGDDAKFCRSCGNLLHASTTPITNDTEAVKPHPPANSSVQPEASAANTKSAASSINEPARTGTAFSSRNISIIVFILILILLAIGGIYYAKNRPLVTPETTGSGLPVSEIQSSGEELQVIETPDSTTNTASEPEPIIAESPVPDGAEPKANNRVETQTKPKKTPKASAVTQKPVAANDPVASTQPETKTAVPAAEPVYEAHFKGLFGLVDEKRRYPTPEMKARAQALWDKERKILEPDGSINEQYAQKQKSDSVIPGH